MKGFGFWIAVLLLAGWLMFYQPARRLWLSMVSLASFFWCGPITDAEAAQVQAAEREG
jgi:hypothetical protein